MWVLSKFIKLKQEYVSVNTSSDLMELDGYKINNEFYCTDCAREYSLHTLSSILSEKEMIALMPTKKISTQNLIGLVNRRGGDLNGEAIIPYIKYDFSDRMNKIKYLSELRNLSRDECTNPHEFGHPYPVINKSIYR